MSIIALWFLSGQSIPCFLARLLKSHSTDDDRTAINPIGRILLCNVHAARVVCLLKSSMILSVLLMPGNVLVVVNCSTQQFWLTGREAITPILAESLISYTGNKEGNPLIGFPFLFDMATLKVY